MKKNNKKQRKYIQEMNNSTSKSLSIDNDNDIDHKSIEKKSIVVESETEEYYEFYTEEDNALYVIIYVFITISSISSIYKQWIKTNTILDEGRLLWSMLAYGDYHYTVDSILYFVITIFCWYLFDYVLINYMRSQTRIVFILKCLLGLISLIYPSSILLTCSWPIIPKLALSMQTIVTLLKGYSFVTVTYEYSKDYYYNDSNNNSNNKNNNIYIPFLSFIRYQFSPSLIYSTNVPYTHKIRPTYIFQKVVIIILSIFRLYTSIVEQIPLLVMYYNGEISFLSVYIEILPLIYIIFMLLFATVFLGICPLFAELTRWPDRRFFSYWWRSSTISEFSRLWNKPVHQFLCKHIYIPCKKMNIPSYLSLLLTYTISAIGHEYILYMSTHKFRPVVSMIILLETPLDYLLKFLINLYPPFSKFFNILFHLAISMFLAIFLLTYVKP